MIVRYVSIRVLYVGIVILSHVYDHMDGQKNKSEIYNYMWC